MSTTSDNKMYRIVNVIRLNNNKRMTDHNPLYLFYEYDHAKEGLKNYFKNYIEALTDEMKKQVGVFWSAEEDEVLLKHDGKFLAKSKIYEIEYYIDGNPVTESIIRYRGCTVQPVEGSGGLYQVISSDKKTISCKPNLSEGLLFIDWMHLILDDRSDDE